MSDNENDHGDVRYRSLQIGVVVQRNDPKNLARVRVRIPGLCDPMSAWAYPMGSPGGGGPQLGLKMVPRMGAEVAVLFKNGDPDVPYYMPANWGMPNGSSEMPTDVKDVSDSPEDIDCLETERYSIMIDNRPGKETMRLKDKKSGDMIEFDGTTATGPGITIQATAAVVIKIDGAFVVDALSATINGRTVADGSQPV